MGKIQRAELAWLLYDPVVELLPPFVLLFLELCEKLLSDWRMDGEQRLVTWTTNQVHERNPCGCNRHVEIPTSNCRQNSHHWTLLLLLLEPTQCRRLENDVPELLVSRQERIRLEHPRRCPPPKERASSPMHRVSTISTRCWPSNC